jgi:hypothetical protein
MNTLKAKKNLRQFNPEEIAKFDASLWQAYYRHQFIKLFFIMFRFAMKIHKDFGFSYLNIIKMAYHTVLAAMDFRLNRNKENKERTIKKLTKAFKIMERYSLEKFDYKKAAELQIDWWFIDRYPEKYNTTREEGIAKAEGVIFNIEPEKLKEYAHFRAKAMTMQDKAEEGGYVADWQEIESLLVKSFTSLHVAINK